MEKEKIEIQESFKREYQKQGKESENMKQEYESALSQKEGIIEKLKEERFHLKNQINSFKIDMKDLTTEVDMLR